MLRIEKARIKEVRNRRLFELLTYAKGAVSNRTEPFSVLHMRSHKWDIGLGQGNAEADRLENLSCPVQVPQDQYVLAREAHSRFHHNAKGLYKQFQITYEEAKAIVRACPTCSNHGPGLGAGVNPRGVKANEIWQMDVTHQQSLGWLRYLHVTIDTFSHFIWVTAQAGEKAIHVTRHLTSCFAVMGVPVEIKTDNGPAYASEKMRRFMQMWGVRHITGIPRSPTGQALVERANATFKFYLQKYLDVVDIQERVSLALYTLNYLCIFGDEQTPAAVKHFAQAPSQKSKPSFKAYYWDPNTGLWQGPAEVVYLGRGYACVSTPTGPLWVPSKWLRPATAEAPITESPS